MSEQDKGVAITDVANQAGVSIATVSRVFNKPSLVRGGTVRKVMDIATMLNYQPDYRGRSLRSGKHWNIGILATVPVDEDPLYSQTMISNLVRFITVEGYGASVEYLILNKSSSNSGTVFPKLVSENKVDGILIVGYLDEPFLKDVARWNIPVCLLDNKCSLKNFYSVSINQGEGSREAVQYLAAFDRRKIGFVYGCLRYPGTRGRYDGFIEAVSELNIECKPEYMIKAEDETLHYRGGYYSTLKLLKQSPEINAIFYINDWYAIGGMAAIQSTGRRVPEDISVIGYDGSWMASGVVPSLTTVSERSAELCRSAVILLTRAVEKKLGSYSEEPNIIIRPRLIKRESCAALGK